MGLDKMAGTKGAIKGEFTGQDTGGDDAGKKASIIAWGSGMSAADAEKVEHGGLGLEDSATAYGADFD
jgi:hypothetical protein